MSNMSYCRFQNTLNDLLDCYGAIQDHSNLKALFEELSPEERGAAKRLISLCSDIAENQEELDEIKDREIDQR